MSEHFATACIEKIDAGFIEEARTFPPDQPKRGYWKRLLITYSVIFIGIAILLSFALFKPTPPYRIEKEDGQYRIQIDPKYVPYGGMAVDSYSPIHRNSVAEMEQAFRQGDFSSAEFNSLGTYADAQGVIPIFDLDNLIEPCLPDPFEYKVVIIPKFYLFNIIIPSTGAKISMREIPQDLFSEATDMAAFHQTIRIRADATDAQDQLQYAYRNNEYQTSESCYYIIIGYGFTYYVTEYYEIMDSEKTLAGMDIYAEPAAADGHYLLIQIHEPKERPGIAWLAQFGCKPYEP